MKKVEIEIPDGKRAEWVNGVLTLVDDTPKDVTERIKTFHDAYCELENEHPFIKAYEKYVNTASGEEADVIAYLKLRIITAALNEGWEPQFAEGEGHWYPWLNVKDGLVYAYANVAGSFSFSFFGVRLAFKSEELAEYAAKQFIDIYKDFCYNNRLWKK